MKSVLPLDKFKSRKEWEAYIWKKLISGLSKANSVQEIEKSLDMLLTAHEKKQMIKRASVISLLKQGKSYRKIGEILWLSPITISAMRKSMRAQAGYVSHYARNKKHEKGQKPLTKKEWDQLRFSLWIDALFTLPPPPLPHPRLNRMLGLGNKFSRKQK